MKINMPKRTPAQKRTREKTLLEELCAHHGYMFADTLPSKDKTTMMMQRTKDPRTGKIKTLIHAAPVIKMMVPAESHLGKLVLAERKERDPATSSAARAREAERTRERARARKNASMR